MTTRRPDEPLPNDPVRDSIVVASVTYREAGAPYPDCPPEEVAAVDEYTVLLLNKEVPYFTVATIAAECRLCGNPIEWREDPTGQRGVAPATVSWGDDRDFQCGLSPVTGRHELGWRILDEVDHHNIVPAVNGEHPLYPGTGTVDRRTGTPGYTDMGGDY